MDIEALLREDVVAAAQALLGWHLVAPGLRARIVETEAYRDDDAASHSFRGPTRRNQTMFGPPGLAYVYFTYGNHWMLNVAALPEGRGAAVLIRAAEPLEGWAAMRERRVKARRDEDLLNGPGKLTQAYGIDRRLDSAPLLRPGGELWLEPGAPAEQILAGTRIGIAIGKGHETPWRFVDANRLRWVSKPWPT